ncbi:DUF1989 domain-containing protein [Rhodococcus hoagii]|nr:DUF1989 domain-containing protein [Prescottella equi]
MLLFRADAPWERLNVADTVKVPWQAYPLGPGHPLLSDAGRVLATVVADRPTPRRTVRHTSAGRESGAIRRRGPALADARRAGVVHRRRSQARPRHRDLPPSLSFFHGIRSTPTGALVSRVPPVPGRTSDLLLHLPVIVLAREPAHTARSGTGVPHHLARNPRLDAAEELDVLRNDDPNTGAPSPTPMTPGLRCTRRTLEGKDA